MIALSALAFEFEILESPISHSCIMNSCILHSCISISVLRFTLFSSRFPDSIHPPARGFESENPEASALGLTVGEVSDKVPARLSYRGAALVANSARSGPRYSSRRPCPGT